MTDLTDTCLVTEQPKLTSACTSTPMLTRRSAADDAKDVKPADKAKEDPAKEPKTIVDEDLLRAFRYFDKTGIDNVSW